MAIQKGIKQVTSNKKAWHDYFVDEKYEAALNWSALRSNPSVSARSTSRTPTVRSRMANYSSSACISAPTKRGNIFNKDPMRKRRLLMHKKEILSLFGKTKQDGYTLIPLSVYFRNSRVKVEIGLCRGKKLHDKRDSIAKRDANREIDRVMKSRNR